MDGAEAGGPAYAHDGACHHVGGGHGQVEHGGGEDGDGGVQVCRQTVHRLHAENLISYGADDSPAPYRCSEAHGQGAGHLHFPGHFQLADITA